MITFRRGVGSDSRNPQIPPAPSGEQVRPVEPENGIGSGRQERVKGRGHEHPRRTGVCDVGDLDRRDEPRCQIAMALMITMKTPIVANSRRPVNATRTGRAKRFTSTRIAAHAGSRRGPPHAAPRSALTGPERERLGDADDAQDQDDDPQEDGVDDGFDDESAHLGLPRRSGRDRSAAVNCGAAGHRVRPDPPARDARRSPPLERRRDEPQRQVRPIVPAGPGALRQRDVPKLERVVGNLAGDADDVEPPRILSSVRARYHGPTECRRREHGIPGARIVVPAAVRLEVHVGQLPDLPRVVDATLEAAVCSSGLTSSQYLSRMMPE